MLPPKDNRTVNISSFFLIKISSVNICVKMLFYTYKGISVHSIPKSRIARSSVCHFDKRSLSLLFADSYLWIFLLDEIYFYLKDQCSQHFPSHLWTWAEWGKIWVGKVAELLESGDDNWWKEHKGQHCCEAESQRNLGAGHSGPRKYWAFLG